MPGRKLPLGSTTAQSDGAAAPDEAAREAYLGQAAELEARAVTRESEILERVRAGM